MAEKRLNTRIIHKHAVEADWAKATNFTPMQGEIIVYDIDTKYNYERIKIGDGKTLVNDLPFVSDALKTEIFAQSVGESVSGKEYDIDGKTVSAQTGAEIFNDYENNVATGAYSHAEGTYTRASGSWSHAEGTDTIASGVSAHAEGSITIASGDDSHAEGLETEASGSNAHAEGQNTVASGESSHAEGRGTIAAGICVHTEGFYTAAYGDGSHAEGARTSTIGSGAHAEGYSTDSLPTRITSKSTSAEIVSAWNDRLFTLAKGEGAHAEGFDTLALGDSAHAEGFLTVAVGEAQHVQGKYNIIDVDSEGNPLNTYAHIVGNGTEEALSNAHTVDWAGNGWFAGDVYVGGDSQDDERASRVITESDHEWAQIYDSGAISSKVNAFANIDVSGYKHITVAIKCVNTTDSSSGISGAIIFKGENEKDYSFKNILPNLIGNTIGTTGGMATFRVVGGHIICENAMRAASAENMLSTTDGYGADNLTPVGSGVVRCTSPIKTMIVSNATLSNTHYYGADSRVVVWGCKV